MADDVAEGAPAGAEHPQAPARARGQLQHGAYVELWRRRQTIAQVLVTLPENLQIERYDQRGTACGLCATDEIIHERPVAHDIELEPERRASRRLGDVFDRADAHGRKRERNAGGARGA